MLEQSECALNQLNLLLSKYKALGIYDNSLIVVTSDHGARVFDDHHINGFPSQFELNAAVAKSNTSNIPLVSVVRYRGLSQVNHRRRLLEYLESN